MLSCILVGVRRESGAGAEYKRSKAYLDCLHHYLSEAYECVYDACVMYYICDALRHEFCMCVKCYCFLYICGRITPPPEVVVQAA